MGWFYHGLCKSSFYLLVPSWLDNEWYSTSNSPILSLKHWILSWSTFPKSHSHSFLAIFPELVRILWLILFYQQHHWISQKAHIFYGLTHLLSIVLLLLNSFLWLYWLLTKCFWSELWYQLLHFLLLF